MNTCSHGVLLLIELRGAPMGARILMTFMGFCLLNSTAELNILGKILVFLFLDLPAKMSSNK